MKYDLTEREREKTDENTLKSSYSLLCVFFFLTGIYASFKVDHMHCRQKNLKKIIGLGMIDFFEITKVGNVPKWLYIKVYLLP